MREALSLLINCSRNRFSEWYSSHFSLSQWAKCLIVMSSLQKKILAKRIAPTPKVCFHIETPFNHRLSIKTAFTESDRCLMIWRTLPVTFKVVCFSHSTNKRNQEGPNNYEFSSNALHNEPLLISFRHNNSKRLPVSSWTLTIKIYIANVSLLDKFKLSKGMQNAG